MAKIEFLVLVIGLALGSALTLYQTKTPQKEGCELYSVSRKVATAYVLKPPPAEVRYEACPQVTKVEPPKTEEQVTEEEKPKPHRRHRRHRRYW